MNATLTTEQPISRRAATLHTSRLAVAAWWRSGWLRKYLPLTATNHDDVCRVIRRLTVAEKRYQQIIKMNDGKPSDHPVSQLRDGVIPTIPTRTKATTHAEHAVLASRYRALAIKLKGCAYELWCASLCSGSQRQHALFEELRDPKPGDLVMETSTHGMGNRDPLEGIGTLVAVGYAPYYATREEARAAGYEDDEPIPTRKVWDITLDFDDGRAFRWENASFIKVKT